MVTQQATIISYDNTFKLLMVLTLVRSAGAGDRPDAGEAWRSAEVHAMD